MARSMTLSAIVGATTLIMAISARATLFHDGVHHVGGLQDQQPRLLDLHPRLGDVARIVPWSASFLPNATRDCTRWQHHLQGAFGLPMVRMQWWMRPGPSRPWAISKPRPSPRRILDAGTRTLL